MANLQNIYDARNKLKGQEVQSKIDASQALKSPTATNPVIKTTSPLTNIANPNQAQTALTASARGGAFDLTPNTTVRTVTGQDTGFTRGLDDQTNQQIYGTGNQVAATPQRTTEVNPYTPTTSDESALSRQYFAQQDQAGLTQDDLLSITGATDAQTARAMLEGRAGLSPEDQLALNQSYEQLKYDKAKAAEEARLMTEEDRIRQDVKDMFAPEFTAARDAGQRAQETGLRVQGRAAMGSKSEQQQQDIINTQQEIERSIAAEQRIQEQMLLAQARGASSEELDALSSGLNNAKQQRQAYQEQLELTQAGLDQAAIDRAEFNTETMLDALKAGFEYDPETDSFTAQEGRQKIDQNISKMLGYASDEFGNQITGADGQPLAIEKDNDIDWGNYTDKYGNTVFYDKANPSNTMKPGGTQVYTGADGSPSSSPTSNNSGSQSLGSGDVYTRDDGSQGLLGENCVKWARENVPNLPWGLNNKKDKLDAINFAVEQGFGSKGGGQAQVGDAILTSEGSVGHAAVVIGVDEQTGELILAEANYTPGQVTQGRRIAMNDPSIYGTVSSTGQPQMSSVINPNAKNEGMNPGISTQVMVESGQMPTDVKFSKGEKTSFDDFYSKGLPKWVSSPQDEAKFMNDLAVYEKQQESQSPVSKLSDSQVSNIRVASSQFGNEQIVKNYNDVSNKAESVGRIIDQGIGGPSDLAVVFEFMKGLDPTSVVRESEYEAAAKAGNIFKGVMAKYNGYMNDQGGFLPPEVKEGFRQIVKTKFDIIDKQYSNLHNQYTKKINSFADGEDVASKFLIDYRVDFGGGDSNAEIDQLRTQLQNPTPQQKIEIATAKKQLQAGEKLVLRNMKFTALSSGEPILPTDIEL